jgi:hypothetical protein
LQRCHEADINMSTAGVYLTYDPYIGRIVPNVWAARGTSVSPAVLEVLIDGSASPRGAKRSTGWTADGHPWLAFPISATFLSSPAVALPRGLERLLVGREFEATSADGLGVGQITTDTTGAFLYGWHTFVRVLGADVGDVIRTTFDLVAGQVLLDLGGSELLDD